MTRSLPSRALAVALTLWVALFMGGSEWLVRCSAHWAVANASRSEIAPADHHAHAASSAGEASSHSAGRHGSAPSESAPGGGSDGHSCACPGPGCCPPGLAALSTSSDPLSRLVAVHAAAAYAVLERLEDAPEHLLPYATAPPVAPLAPAAQHRLAA